MDNEKRIFLAILLSIVVLYAYQAFFMPPPVKQQRKTATPEEKAVPAPAPVAAPSAAVPQITPAPADAASEASDRAITVDGSLMRARFSAAGADIRSVQLMRYRETIPQPAMIRLFKKMLGAAPDPHADKPKEVIAQPAGRRAILRTLFVGADATVLGDGPWETTAGDAALAPDRPHDIPFIRQERNGLVVERTYTLRDADYKIDCAVTLRNKGGTPLTGSPVIEWVAAIPAAQGGGMFGGPVAAGEFAYHINGGVTKRDLTKIKEPVAIEGDILWAGIEEKYFAATILPGPDKPAQLRLTPGTDRTVAYQMVYPAVTLQPGESRACRFSLYLGPKDIDMLKQQGSELEKTVVFGWFDIIARPLLVSLKFFHRYLGNYGLAIIILTVIIKILFWPLTHKSFSSMKEMQKLQPELAQLKEKYKDNKEEFARQQLALYKKYKVNPLSGCLPTLIQIPVFIALYNALMYAIELRHAPFISFWINDLSAKDPTYIAPIVMGLSMFVQQKMTPTTADPAQAKMMLFMPVVFTVMFLSFPSGLVLYWLVNNVISIVQQVYINRKLSASGGTTVCTQSKLKQSPSKKRSR